MTNDFDEIGPLAKGLYFIGAILMIIVLVPIIVIVYPINWILEKVF